MCIYPHSFAVLCLRAPIRLHHLHSSLQNNVHKEPVALCDSSQRNPVSLPGDSVTSCYSQSQKFPFSHTLNSGILIEQSSSGLDLDWNKLWDSHVWEFGTLSPGITWGWARSCSHFWGCDSWECQDPAKCGFVFLIHEWFLRQGGILTRRIKE